MNKNIFQPADILLPKDADMEKWAVIACDQFTSDQAYWDRVRAKAGDSPSTIRLILPVAAEIMGQEGRFLTLIKPQFEAGRGQVGKNGVVREKETHVRVLREICAFAPSFGWHVRQLTFSPIKGPAGNIEFLADIRAGPGDEIPEDSLRALVDQAHRELKA